MARWEKQEDPDGPWPALPFPIFSQMTDDPHWLRLLHQTGPLTGALAIQTTTDLRSLPIIPWATSA
jgi:hypothetical protein